MGDAGTGASIIAALVGEDYAYFTAFLFGALVIAFFARDQFNRPSHEGARELTRLIEMLTPSAMRRRNVFWRAYVFYVAILVMIYATLCIYGLLIGPAIGLVPPGYDAVGASALPDPATAATGGGLNESGFNPDDRPSPQELRQSDADRFRSDSAIPLFISLIMVGLAPRLPLLERVEERIRFMAHRFSGIPTRLVKGGRKLHEIPLNLGNGDDHLLVPPKDWQRIHHYVAAAVVDDKTALREDLEKIMAFRSWILQEKLASDNFATRDNLDRVEGDVRKEVDSVIFTLDSLSGFAGAADPHGAKPADKGVDPAQHRVAWEAAARQADQVCGDICVLNMLYVEHGVLPTRATAHDFGWARDPGENAAEPARQKYLAERKLIDHLDAAVAYVDRENFVVVLWVRASGAILAVSLIYGMMTGLDTAIESRDSRIVLGLDYMMQAAVTYVLALLVGINWRQNAYRTNAWHNVFQSHWAQWLTPYSSVFVISGIVALICVVGLNIITIIVAFGVEPVLQNAWAVLRAAVEYEGPRAMLGPVLTVLVLLIVDARQGGDKGRVWLDGLPWATGAAMFLAGGAARLASSKVGAVARQAEFKIFDPDVWQPALSAALWAGLIGLAVALLVRGTLQFQFLNAQQQQRPGTPPAGSDAAPTGSG